MGSPWVEVGRVIVEDYWHHPTDRQATHSGNYYLVIPYFFSVSDVELIAKKRYGSQSRIIVYTDITGQTDQ
jgi:hypothetical protein